MLINFYLLMRYNEKEILVKPFMIDNSSWLKRLLAKTEKRQPKNISLWAILKHNKNFYNATSLLWCVFLIFIFLYVFMELGFMPNYFLQIKDFLQQALRFL
jgi:hypothetical protein